MQSNDRSGAARENASDETRIGAESIRRHLIEQIARRSGTTVAEIDPDRPLEEFGLASRDAVAIAGELEELLGRALPATLVWEHPTINKLSAALSGGGAEAPGHAPGHAPEPRRETANDEPIAVVGVGLRFPGGDRDLTGPGDFWRFLTGRGDAIREVPDGRWDPFDDGSPEVSDLLANTTRLGGFLDDVAGFDARFFGITPREAAVMDPQQRLVLEVAWEAFEHAGIAPASLRGTRTGVFVGVSAPEYAAFTASDLAALEPFTATGAALGIIANRLSYLLDLRGPSMIVDTACSSSLVSTHLAVGALRAGEADVALAGGVNVLLSPTVTMTFDLAGGTASDGRCKAFDASADGMVRAEGCGAVVLKRLPDARRDGDRVLAVIRGSGVNSDGRSNGLVAPNSNAQRVLLRDVYADAGVDPREVDYVEAHGTGTLLGDPIEAKAVGGVLGVGRDPGAPLLLGSVKSNLGHMESAAGMAGLIKTVLALHHGVIPPSAHYKEPNPHIPFDELGLAVVADETPWPERGRPARAGVSGFGFGGTNAHIVLEKASAQDATVQPAVVRTFPLSDTTDDRVRDHAALLAEWHPGQDVDLADVALTLHRRGGRGRARAAVVARDEAGFIEGLTALAGGRPHPGVVSGTALGAPGRPAWVFSGYGAQRAGMAKRLLEEEPAFAEAIDDLDPLFAAEGVPDLWALLEEGRKPDGPADTMPVLFAIQIGLARMWTSYGVTPGAVIGHSMGEVAAAVVAGAITLEDGVRVICRRSRLLTRLVGGGAMAVLGASAGDVERLADGLPEVHAAVHSSPEQTVVTGDADQIAEIVKRAEAEGRLARMVQAEGAGHSPQVDPLLPDLRDLLAGVGAEPGDPLADDITLYTTALDDPRASSQRLDAEYWAANLRNPVRLADAVAAAAEDGFRTFVEVNAHPILASAIGETLEGTGALVTHTLKRAPKGQETDDTLTFHAQLATLAAHGHTVTGPADGRIVDVPPSPWRHERHWVDLPARHTGKDEHPLLGAHVELPGEDRHAWRADVGLAAQPWLNDVTVHGLHALPVAAFAEMALAAGASALGIEDVRVNGLRMERPLALTEQTTVTTTFAEVEQRLEVHALTPAGTWTRLAGADVCEDHRDPPSPGTGATTEVTGAERGSRHYRLHPEVFDRCLSVLSDEAAAVADGVWLAETVGTLRVYGPTHRGGRVRATAVQADDGMTGAVLLLAADGQVLAEATGIVLRRAERHDIPVPLTDKLVELAWEETPLPPEDGLPVDAAAEGGTWLLLAEQDDALAGAVTVGLEGRGKRVVRHRLTRRVPDEHPNADEQVEGVLVVPAADLVDEELILTVAGVSRSLPDGPRLYTATRAAVPVCDGEPGEPGQGFISALTRVLAFERAVQRATHVDVDRPRDLVAELVEDDDAREVAWRGGTRYVARLVRGTLPERPTQGIMPGGPAQGVLPERPTQDVEPERPAEGVLPGQPAQDGPPEQPAQGGLAGEPEQGVRGARPVRGVRREKPGRRRIVRRGGAYVITGGYGGVGLVTARLLALRGAGRIVLSGRSGPGAEAEKVITQLREDGADVRVVLGDIARPGTAERLVEAARDGGARLCGVVHGAGAINDRLIIDLGPDDLHRVWTAKVEGARRLSEAVWDADLDWFVTHSSAAALLGSPGQAAYAAANAAIDALTAFRRANGRPGTTINWGTWSRVGGVAGTSVAVVDPISPDEGAEALETLLAHGKPATGVLRFDPRTAVELFPEIRAMPYFAALTEAVDGTGGVEVTDWPGVDALKDVDPATARAMIATQVRYRIAAVLGFDPRLDPAVPLTDLGLDSLVAVRIKSGVEHDLGLTVPASVLLQGASVDAFEEWAAGELGLAAAPALVLVPPPTPASGREPAPSRAPTPERGPAPSRVSVPGHEPTSGRASVPGHEPTSGRAPAPDRVPAPGREPGLGRASAPGRASTPGRMSAVGGVSVPGSGVVPGRSSVPGSRAVPGRLSVSGRVVPDEAGVSGLGGLAKSNAEGGCVMPRDAAERLAVRVFEDVLGLDRVSVTADFFAELGGGDHQADQVVALVAAELGGEVTRGELFETPTAENVAEYIRAADEEAARQTVRPLKASGTRRPIFIAHPAGGTTACYRQLIDLLGADQPVHGLERFEDAPPVEERAARYVRHLVEARPEGAFRLGGWSFGGVLAYETARQLRAQGREVEFVALFDAGLPRPVEDESDTLARRFSAFADYVNETYGLDVSLTYDELSGLPEEAQFALVMERAAPLVDHIPPAALTHQLTSHQDTRSLEAYRPEPYEGRVILYRAPEQTPWAVRDARYVLDGTNGFGELCADLEIVPIPGAHHLDLLDPPGVGVLAAHLEARLAGRRESDAVPTPAR